MILKHQMVNIKPGGVVTLTNPWLYSFIPSHLQETIENDRSLARQNVPPRSVHTLDVALSLGKQRPGGQCLPVWTTNIRRPFVSQHGTHPLTKLDSYFSLLAAVTIESLREGNKKYRRWEAWWGALIRFFRVAHRTTLNRNNHVIFIIIDAFTGTYVV